MRLCHLENAISTPLSQPRDRPILLDMSDPQTMVQTEVTFDGTSFLLAQDQDVRALRRDVEAATRTSGTFVDFVVVGNREVSVLVTPQSRVSISTAAVAYDGRDTGDLDFPFGGYYDEM